MENNFFRSTGSKRDTNGDYKIEDIENGLEELFLKELRDVLWAEKALTDGGERSSDQLDAEIVPRISETEPEVHGSVDPLMERLTFGVAGARLEVAAEKNVAPLGAVSGRSAGAAAGRHGELRSRLDSWRGDNCVGSTQAIDVLCGERRFRESERAE